MKMTTLATIGFSMLVGVWTIANPATAGQVNSNDNRISMVDKCKPGDPGWAPQGCDLPANRGDVSRAEFDALLTTPLGNQLIGHPSWRNEPSHSTADRGKTIRLRNEGGRGHTFTEVANFGGGTIPDLNVGLTRAPECPASPTNLQVILPGGNAEVSGLASGLHKFQCCIHPWMRATVRVQ
jgi:plastocyanin